MTLIYEVEKPTNIDLKKLERKRIVWIFDIDETLVTHDGEGDRQEAIDPQLPTWINSILTERPEDAICFLTARLDPTKIFPYNKKPEKDLLKQLGIINTQNQVDVSQTCEQLTLNNHVPLFTYTSGDFKGNACLKIINHYKKFGFKDFYFLDDRLTQIKSVQDTCGPEVTAFWISSLSQEIHLAKKYSIIRDLITPTNLDFA
jgi:hypothetical protein